MMFIRDHEREQTIKERTELAPAHSVQSAVSLADVAYLLAALNEARKIAEFYVTRPEIKELADLQAKFDLRGEILEAAIEQRQRAEMLLERAENAVKDYRDRLTFPVEPEIAEP